jgi:MFS family permease
MTQTWQLILYWGVFVGFGTGCLALVFAAIVANRWFEKRRGLVTGVFSAAYATGSLLFLPLIANLVTDQGWRQGTLVVAVFALAVIPIFWLGFRERPADVGLLPFGASSEPDESEKPPTTVRATIAVLRQAAKTRAFWVLAGTFFVCGWTTNGLIGAHFIPAAHDHGAGAVVDLGLRLRSPHRLAPLGRHARRQHQRQDDGQHAHHQRDGDGEHEARRGQLRPQHRPAEK